MTGALLGREWSNCIGEEGSRAIVLGREEVLVLRFGKGRGAPEMVFWLQREQRIKSDLLQCDPMGREEPIDLS